MQIQLDPNIPANLSPEQLRDFKSFLDVALDGLTAAAGGEVFATGNALFGGLAVIVVVLNGLKIAFSGNIQPWELVRVVIGLWIPWVMLQFYTTTIPGMAFTFPGMIAAGGNWLHELLIGDAVYSMQTELGNLIRSLAANQAAQAQAGNTLRPTHRRDSCRDNGGCGVCNVCVCSPYAASVGRRHLRSSDLGADRACHSHHLGSDLYSVSGVRSAVVSVLGMVPGDDYLLALCRDRRSGAARLLRCRNLLHHELGECQPGHARAS